MTSLLKDVSLFRGGLNEDSSGRSLDDQLILRARKIVPVIGDSRGKGSARLNLEPSSILSTGGQGGQRILCGGWTLRVAFPDVVPASRGLTVTAAAMLWETAGPRVPFLDLGLLHQIVLPEKSPQGRERRRSVRWELLPVAHLR